MDVRWIGGLVVCVMAACGSRVAGSTDDGEGTGTSEASETSATTPTSVTSPESTLDTTLETTVDATGTTLSTTGPGDTSGDACADEVTDDGGVKLDIGIQHECDIFLQDCQRGEKCVTEGFYIRVCVPLVDTPLADGDPCEEMPFTDECGPGSECVLDPSGDAPGTCRPQCTGSLADPECPMGSICVIAEGDATAHCDRPCMPLDDDACPGFACLETDQGFACLPPGNSLSGERCSSPQSCAAGHVCRPGDEVAGCCDASCCSAVCDAEHPCVEGTCVPIAGDQDIGWCQST